MFILDVIKLIILLIFAYFVATLYKEYLPVDNQMADWTMKLISDGEAIIVSFFCLTIIFVLLRNPIKRLGLTFYGKRYKQKYQKWQGFVLIVIIMVLMLYLVVEYKYFLILPFLTFIFIEYVIKIK